MERITLRNGLSILYHYMPNTHSITIGLYVKMGIAYEPETYVGISHFLEHLNYRRIGDMDQHEIYYQMERIGSGIKGNCFEDYCCFSMKIVPCYLKECLKIFKNMVGSTSWTQDEFEQEKQLVLQQIKQRDEYVFLNDQLRKIIFKKSSLAERILGKAECIQGLTKEKVQNYRNRMFCKQNIVLCITGNVDLKTMKDALTEVEDIVLTDGIEAACLQVPQVFHHRKPEVLWNFTPDDILDVNLSFDVSGETYQTQELEILNCILGEGTGSKLQKKIREQYGYTFDIYSYIEKYKNFAVFNVRFSVKKDLFEKCLEEILKEINDTKKCITSRDLEVSLPFYTSNLQFIEDDTEEMNKKIAYEAFVMKNSEQQWLVKNDEQSREKIKALSKKIFLPENVCVVVVGNTKGLTKKQVRDNLLRNLE